MDTKREAPLCFKIFINYKSMIVKTDAEWTNDIIKITTEIRSKYPELIKYIDEMPINLNGTNSSNQKPNTMQDYFESLEGLVKKYQVSHEPKTHSLFTVTTI
jgi:hypothetical protein